MNERQDTFANRLNIAMEKEHINQVELAELTKTYPKKISQSLINKYLKGKAIARQNNIYILAKILDVNEAWLMGYDVPIERVPDYLRTSDNIIKYIATDASMSPLLDIDDIAYVERKENFQDGETILFRIDNIDYIRKVNDKGDYIEFRAMNPYFPLLVFTKEELRQKNFKLIGRVIKAENKSAFKI